MDGPMSYLLCGTPRTGSTLLCSLLASTGVAGRPESYFRAPDRRRWAERFRIPVGPDGTVADPAFVAGAVRVGSTPNGVFAARVMWGTAVPLPLLTDTVGPLRFVHLRRGDVVGQAVSWARAEQSGYWQQGDGRSGTPRFDRRQIEELVGTVHEHDVAWRRWFADQGTEPIELTYETLTASPRAAVIAVLDAIGTEPPAGWVPASPHRRQADALNAEWVERYRAGRR